MGALWEFIQGNYLQIVDILLVATLFYYLFAYVRGTKTAVVLQGIVVLTLVYFACVYLELITLVFILKGILVVGPLALFIIFAPEIRQVLERAGGRSRAHGGARHSGCPRVAALSAKGVRRAAHGHTWSGGQ